MVGDSIRAERSRVAMSQEVLARRIGVNERTLRRWERGDSQVPADQLTRIASVLQCPIERFFLDQSAPAARQ